MSAYDDYPPPRRDRRQPRDDYRGYAESSDDYNHRPRQPRHSSAMNGTPHGADSTLPPPPVGDALKSKPPSALKREGSRGRVPNHVRPEFPDEASYLGSQAPDAERKNRPRDRRFRDMRDGYESEEGEHHRRNTRRPQADDRHGDSDRDRDRRRHPRGGDPYDDDRAPAPRRRHDPYEDDRDRQPPRRTRDRYDDEEQRPRRRGGGGVEYGSDPVPAVRRSNTDRQPRDRRNDYSDDDSSYRPRRRRSHDDRRRREDPYDDHKRRSDRDRRNYSDDDYHDDRRDGRRNRPPKEIKIGKYDVGPMVEKGQKHYKTIAPIVTPIVMTMAKKYLSGGK